MSDNDQIFLHTIIRFTFTPLSNINKIMCKNNLNFCETYLIGVDLCQIEMRTKIMLNRLKFKSKSSLLILLILFTTALTSEMGAGMSVFETDKTPVTSPFEWLDKERVWMSDKYIHPNLSFKFPHNRPVDFKSMQFSKNIMSNGLLSAKRLASFLWFNNPEVDIQKALQLAEKYIEEAKIEGINHDIAFSQMCLETGFLKFTGDVCVSQFNYCGLGATGNKEPGLTFANMGEGVRAHIQHLKAYGSIDSLNTPLLYNRFRFVERGSATHLHALTGKWATDPLYGSKLESLLGRMYSGSYVFQNI